MTNHYFDEHGFYSGSAPANPGSEPPVNALRVAPPVREGFRAALNDARDGWELVAADAAPALIAADARYFLNRTGKYHAEGCRHARGKGEWLRLVDIHLLRPTASPCARCAPPRAGAAR